MAIATIITAISTAVAAVSTVLGSTAFTIGTFAVTWGAIAQTIIFGGIALSSTIQANQKPSFDSSSPTYRNGVLQTQTDQNLPIPLLYGTCKLAGNRIWQDTNSQNPIKRIVAFAEGEITEFSDIRLNDIPINEIAGIKINKYYGTNNQTVDNIVGGSNLSERIEKVGSLKNIAYIAITVPRTAKIDLNYNLTAVVKGRKIRVYRNKDNYTIQYSENPAWVLFDFLTSYNGLGLGIDKSGNINENFIQQLFDLDSFIEAAEYCDELIEYNNGKTIEKTPRFTFNMIFDAQTSARDLIDEIFRSCRGGLFVKDGKLQFKIDKKEPVSKVFTENDIIKGSECFQTIPKDEQYDILKCSFISPNHAWQKVEATAELPEYNADIPIEHSVNILSVTNFQQASRLAWYYINSKRLQPYFGSFQTDYRAFDIEVGDVICIDSILMGLKKYKIKVTKIEDSGAGIFTIHWRNYDERLYNDDLGSKEPTVLISTLSDVLKYPDDVKNFNVIQSNNLFNFVWEENKDTSNTYEIRVGENWECANIVKSNISENHFSTNIKSTGLQKFWIKAFNSYNYSENATLDVININSIPQLNELVKLNILDNLNGTFSDTLKTYQNTIKLKETNTLWKSTENYWSNNSFYYQNGGIWGSEVNNFGVYTSEIFDIGDCLESIVSFDLEYTSPDKQSQILAEWAFSTDGINFTNWTLTNNGSYYFRFCKFKITINSPNNIQTVLTKFLVNIDVPDKNLDIDVEITDINGLKIDYEFVNTPSIVATVNDNNNAYVVITEKTNKYAILKAYTNSGELTTCKLSLSAKGY